MLKAYCTYTLLGEVTIMDIKELKMQEMQEAGMDQLFPSCIQRQIRFFQKMRQVRFCVFFLCHSLFFR